MMSTNDKPAAAPLPTMRRSLRQLGSDVVTLCELQGELLQVDVREWMRACTVPIALILVTALLGLASFPVLLVGLAYGLREWTEWPLWGCFLSASGAGLGAAVLCGLVAVRLLRRDARILSRSSAELRRNVRWLKEVLSSPASAARHQP
jgi:hypothetical protein